MKRIALVSLLLSLCAAAAVAQDAKPSPTPAPPQQKEEPAAEEKVYREDEVDVKAKQKGFAGVRIRMAGPGDIQFTPDCPARGSGTLGLVVNKSGKVTAVTLVKRSGCAAFDSRSVRDAWKTKFTPALKDGQPVTQEATIITRYVWPKGRR